MHVIRLGTTWYQLRIMQKDNVTVSPLTANVCTTHREQLYVLAILPAMSLLAGLQPPVYERTEILNNSLKMYVQLYNAISMSPHSVPRFEPIHLHIFVMTWTYTVKL